MTTHQRHPDDHHATPTTRPRPAPRRRGPSTSPTPGTSNSADICTLSGGQQCTAAVPATRRTVRGGCCAAAPTACASTLGRVTRRGLAAGDPTGEVTAAWSIGQDLKHCYRTRDQAAAQQVITAALDCPVPEVAHTSESAKIA